MTDVDRRDALETYVAALKGLQPDNLGSLDAVFDPNARFKDPFSDVVGLSKIKMIFEDMFVHVHNHRFDVQHITLDGSVGVMTWVLSGDVRGKPWEVEGASKVKIGEDGKITEHIDYWDAATGLYERIPVIGWLLAGLRRRIGVQ